MPFSANIKQELLVKACGCCCLCRELFDDKLNIYHIVPEEKGGSNDEDNAIALCSSCYDKISKNKKEYTPEKLRVIRDEWFKQCKLLAQEVILELGGDFSGREPLLIPLQEQGLNAKVTLEQGVELKDCVNNPELIKVDFACFNCVLPLEKEYETLGSYRGVRWLRCPSCGFTVKYADQLRLEKEIRRKIISQIMDKEK